MDISKLASSALPLRFAPNAGIAIGPILFIIAVLGILAAAIAAGSGSFSTGATGESNRAKAAALVDIGQNLKVGFERCVGNETLFADVIIDPTLTTLPVHLFSPSGGGITPPSQTMGFAVTDPWIYPLIVVPGIGTDKGEKFAMQRVTREVCDEINLKVNAMPRGTATTNVADFGDFSSVVKIDDTAVWPADFQGKPVGCLQNSNTTTAGYYFYQVIGIQ